jgi:hypothetical protein
MQLCNFTDEELERMVADRSKGVDYTHGDETVRATQLAIGGAFQELLDRRRADALHAKTGVAMKLAIAHIEMLRGHALDQDRPLAVACLDMQLAVLKEFDQP